MASERTIFVVDDDEAVRESLGMLLEACDYYVELFASAREFLERVQADRTGCLLLDVRMPDISGLELQTKLNAEGFTLPVIIMTGHGDVPMAVQAMQQGAVDFIEKPFTDDVITQSIEKALAKAAPADIAEAATRLKTLTPRERDVLEHLVVGQPNKVIAYELGISPRTIEIHRARVMEKMHARSLSHLVRMALAIGINPDEHSLPRHTATG
ncbi:MAG: response regulator FixJ [Geminicoccaceae bacterium]